MRLELVDLLNTAHDQARHIALNMLNSGSHDPHMVVKHMHDTPILPAG